MGCKNTVCITKLLAYRSQLSFFYFEIVDPAYVEFSPDVMDQNEGLKTIMEQNSNTPVSEENVKAIVSHILSSKFPEVRVSSQYVINKPEFKLSSTKVTWMLAEI